MFCTWIIIALIQSDSQAVSAASLIPQKKKGYSPPKKNHHATPMELSQFYLVMQSLVYPGKLRCYAHNPNNNNYYSSLMSKNMIPLIPLRRFNWIEKLRTEVALDTWRIIFVRTRPHSRLYLDFNKFEIFPLCNGFPMT